MEMLPREFWMVVSTIIDDDDEEGARNEVAERLGPDYTVVAGAP